VTAIECISSLLVFHCSIAHSKGGTNTKVVLEHQGNEGRAPLLNSIVQILNYRFQELLNRHIHKHYWTYTLGYRIQTSSKYFFWVSVTESKHRVYIYIQITKNTENHPYSPQQNSQQLLNLQKKSSLLPLKFVTITNLHGILINWIYWLLNVHMHKHYQINIKNY